MAETKTIPVFIKGVDLQIDLRIDPEESGGKLKEALMLVEQIKEKFGNDVLIEQLGVVLAGHVEKVTIIGGERKPVNVPVQVNVAPAGGYQPPKYNPAPDGGGVDYGMYRMVTPHPCPVTGYQLNQIDPLNLRDFIATKKELLHPQDAHYIGAYLAALDSQPKAAPTQVQQTLSFDEDSIPI